MKKRIIRGVFALLIFFGVYGIFAFSFFVKQNIFSNCETDVAKSWKRIEPEINERTAKLDLAVLAPAEQTNIQKIVKWTSIDYGIAREMTLKEDVALFSLSISLFAILLGLIGILWVRQSEIKEQIGKLAQQKPDA